MGFFDHFLKGAADSVINLAAQGTSETKPMKKGSIAGNCRPCAAAAKRNAMNQKWQGGLKK